MAYNIVEEIVMGVPSFVIRDEDIFCDALETREDAEKELEKMKLEDTIADAASEAVDDMMDRLYEKFPTFPREKIRQLVYENM